MNIDWMRVPFAAVMALLVLGLAAALLAAFLAMVNPRNWIARTPIARIGEASVRNLGLIVGGFMGLLLAGWREGVAGKQADVANRQANGADLSTAENLTQEQLDSTDDIPF